MKLLHKVVKSSQGMLFDGEVSIDNTVVIKEKPISKTDEKDTTEALPPEIEKEINLRIEKGQKQLEIDKQKVLEEIHNMKSKVISEAMTEAERIRREADTGAIVMREQAKDIGFEIGRKKVLDKLKKEIKAAATLLEELNAQKEAFYISHENEIIDLVYDMVKKITLTEIKTDREIIFGIMKQACKSFRNSDYVKISIAKCDVSESVITDEKLLKKIAGNIPDIEIELLPDAESGTIILDNDKEIIDASVPTQLKFLKEIMDSGKK